MIIPGFNIFKNIQTHLFSGFEFCSINQLRFEGFEKAFSNRVIPAIAFTTHTLFGFQRFQQIDGLFTSVLNSSVRMENHSFRKRPVFVGHPDSRDDGFLCAHSITHGPTNQFPVKKIQYARHIQKPITTRNISQIRDTRFYRLIPVKIPVQQIWSNLIIVRGIRGYFEAPGKLATQTHLSHMTGHCSSGNGSSRCLQIFGKPWAAIAPFGRKIRFFNLFVQFHIITFAFTLRLFKPTVIRASRYLQHFTHHLNRPLFRVVLIYKLKNQRPLLEMMLNAFFNISRSISASLRRFSNSVILLVSSFIDWIPGPGKLEAPFSLYSFRHRYNRKGAIPNSWASSDTFLRSKLNLTAFSLNALP